MRRVDLLIETSRTYGRDLLREVKRYAVEHGPRSMFTEIRDLESRPPPWIKQWNGDGILVRSGSDAIASAVKPEGQLMRSHRGILHSFHGEPVQHRGPFENGTDLPNGVAVVWLIGL